jgi:hypothetical protein
VSRAVSWTSWAAAGHSQACPERSGPQRQGHEAGQAGGIQGVDAGALAPAAVGSVQLVGDGEGLGQGEHGADDVAAAVLGPPTRHADRPPRGEDGRDHLVRELLDVLHRDVIQGVRAKFEGIILGDQGPSVGR